MKVLIPKYFWLPEIAGHPKHSKGVPSTIIINDIIKLENGKPIYTSFSKLLLDIGEGLLNYYSNQKDQNLHQPELAFLAEVEFVKTNPSNFFPHQYKFSPKVKFNGSELEYLPKISSAKTYDFFRIKTMKSLLTK